MYRRRRPSSGEVAFSFDSFLDLVTNVVGIIIRLILVSWVGARAYQSYMEKVLEEPGAPPPKAVANIPLPRDPLQDKVVRAKSELEEAKARLYEQLKQLEALKDNKTKVNQELAGMSAKREEAGRRYLDLDRALANGEKALPPLNLSLADLRERSREIFKEIEKLEKLPPLKKVLRFRTPVSRPVLTDQLAFECQYGRVAFVDMEGFEKEIELHHTELGKQLRDTGRVRYTAGPIGAFNLTFVLERQGFVGDAGLRQEKIVEPINSARGEPLAKALAPGSEFRRIVDGGFPGTTVITFFVYPDSFAMYRQLRDLLQERGLEVAAHPLIPGEQIRFSPQGVMSRGQ